MGENDSKIDDGILKYKKDVLRARETALTNHPQSAEPLDLISDVVRANKKSRDGRQQSGIPSFDLRNKILSKQRHATAAKRTAPQKSSPEASRIEPERKLGAGEGKLVQPGFNSLIAEIVACDIRRLCSGEAMAI